MATGNLHSSIQYSTISTATKYQIIRQLWGSAQSFAQFRNSQTTYDDYFRYYSEQCRLALLDGERHSCIRTHQHISDIVNQVKQPITREDVRENLRSRLLMPVHDDTDEILNNAIDLAVRLLLMIEVGGFQYGISGHTSLRWMGGTLKGFVHERFDQPRILGRERVKLGKIFTARNLQRIAGIQIIWTSNLADHLRMRDDDSRVAIFYYASFLQYQRSSLIFDPAFINETLQTLALLFPQYDKETKRWFRKLRPKFNLDPGVIRCGHLRAEDRQIENFQFWHDRLVILKQVFDEAEPSSISQWWYDRRNGVQWYTFWIAAVVLILTVVFGVVQGVEGALQVYKAYFPS